MSNPLALSSTIDALHLYSLLYQRVGEILVLLGLAKVDQYFTLSGLEEIDLESPKTATFTAGWTDWYCGDCDRVEHDIPVRYLWMSDADIFAEEDARRKAAKSAGIAKEVALLEETLTNAIRYRNTAAAGAQLAVDRAERELQWPKDRHCV